MDFSVSDQPIRVKLLSKSSGEDPDSKWGAFLPGGDSPVGRCRFVFDPEDRNYDWLVVYDDLPGRRGQRFTVSEEVLACPRKQTLLITTEPSSIKVYGRAFLDQFGWVLTSQEPWVVRHSGAIFCQPGLIWFYGKEYDRIVREARPEKTALFSTVCSSKQQRHTLHQLRYRFTQQVKAALPELEIYGHGVRPIDCKAEALDPYRYHLAIENHIALHHWTEKLSDAFLGRTLPFYYGAPNAAEYFPEESFVPIDIRDPERAIARMREVMEGGEYERRLPAIEEARRLVLEEYGIFQQLARLIAERHPAGARESAGGVIQSRHAWRRTHPVGSLFYLWERLRARWGLGRQSFLP